MDGMPLRSAFKRRQRLKSLLAGVTTAVLLAASQLACASTELASSPSHVPTASSHLESLGFMEQVDAFVVPGDIGPNDTWLHIDLLGRRLIVLRGNERLDAIPYVAYGASGYRRVRVQGSSQTPVGVFTIQRVNDQSKFRTFMEFDYPTPNAAWAARAMGLLSDAEYRHFQSFRTQHGMSPPNTRLGGHIGLHGLGRSDEWTHKRRDWTEGCIAVTNEEIDRIERWIDVGSKVVVRG